MGTATLHNYNLRRTMIPIIAPASSPHAIFPDIFQNRCHHVRGIGTGTSIRSLLGLDSDTFYIYHVAAVMVDNLRRLLLGINLSDKAIMDFDFPGVGFPV